MDCLPNPQRGAVTAEPAHGLKFTQALDQMHEELGAVLARLTPDMAETLIQELETAPRIFGCAAGRSGFILRGFLMRLMHLGFTVYFVGETTTPRVRPGDLLMVMSGSGETAQPREMQRRANAVGRPHPGPDHPPRIHHRPGSPGNHQHSRDHQTDPEPGSQVGAMPRQPVRTGHLSVPGSRGADSLPAAPGP